MLPILFTTLKRCLGTEDTKCWSFSGVSLSHSACKQVLRGVTVQGIRCRIFCFKTCHTFSIGDKPAQSVKPPHTLLPQPCLCNVCRMWFCIVLLKYALAFLERMTSWRQHILLENLYFSALMVLSQKCKLPLPRALTQPYTMTDPGNSLDGPFLLWSGAHGVHFFQKRPEILICLTTIHISTVWGSIPDASEPREVDSASGHG